MANQRPLRFSAWPGSPGVVKTVALGGGGGEVSDAITILQRFVVSGIGSFAGGGGLWDPTSPGGLIAEIDMLNPASYVESGGLVTSVINLRSSTSWPAASSCPFEATGINGHPCLHPLDITDYFTSTEAAVVNVLDSPGTNKPHTLVYVDVPDSTSSGGAIFSAGNSGVASASTRTWGRRVGQTQHEYIQTVPALNGNGRTASSTVSAGLNITAWTSAGGTPITLRVNDSSITVNESVAGGTSPIYTPGTGPNRVSLFSRCDSSPDSPIATRFGALYLYDHALSLSDLGEMYDYLLPRWS